MKRVLLFLFVPFLFHESLWSVNQKNMALGALGVVLFSGSLGYSAMRHKSDWKEYDRLSSNESTMKQSLYELNNKLRLGDEHSKSNKEIISYALQTTSFARWRFKDTTSPFNLEEIYKNFNRPLS